MLGLLTLMVGMSWATHKHSKHKRRHADDEAGTRRRHSSRKRVSRHDIDMGQIADVEEEELEKTEVDITSAYIPTTMAPVKDEKENYEGDVAIGDVVNAGGDQTSESSEMATELPDQRPTVSPLRSPIETPTQSPAETPTASPIETPTVSAAETLTQSPAETPTASPVETPTRSPAETPTVSPVETPTQSPAETLTASPIETPTVPAAETLTQSPAETPTVSPVETPTRSPAETPTVSPVETPTRSPAETPTVSPVETPTASAAETLTQSPAETPTASPIETPTESPVETPTASATEISTTSPAEILTASPYATPASESPSPTPSSAENAAALKPGVPEASLVAMTPNNVAADEYRPGGGAFAMTDNALPRLVSVTPKRVAIDGGTLVTARYDFPVGVSVDRAWCRIGGHVIQAEFFTTTAIQCRTPEMPVAQVSNVSVSLDGAHWSKELVEFHFEASRKLRIFDPISASAFGVGALAGLVYIFCRRLKVSKSATSEGDFAPFIPITKFATTESVSGSRRRI